MHFALGDGKKIFNNSIQNPDSDVQTSVKVTYIIHSVLFAFLLVLSSDLLKDRRINDDSARLKHV